jgi:hypothetical protein
MSVSIHYSFFIGDLLFHEGIFLLVMRIAYFSGKGHTQEVATILAKRVNAGSAQDRTAQKIS